MNSLFERYGTLAGRVLMSAIFLQAAAGKAAHFSMMTGYVASKGLPAPALMLALAMLTEAAGGLSILLGFKARWGALLLFLFLIPTTLLFHDFWALTGAEAQNMQIHFMKNLAIMGGLLFLSAHGAGPLSLDGAGSKS